VTRRYFALALFACTISSLFAIAASYFCGPSGLSLPAPELQTLRLSRTALACIAGGALSLSGAIFQTLLRNPLADPYIVGVSGGSALFGASALLFGLSSFYVSSSALAGALAVSFMLAWLLSKDKSDNADATLLAGVVFNAFVGAALTLFKTLVPAQKSQELLFWLIGTLTYIDASTIIILSVCIALCALFAFIKSGSLETLNLGESDDYRSPSFTLRFQQVPLARSSALSLSPRFYTSARCHEGIHDHRKITQCAHR